MFTTTRELLSKHINPKLLRDLEADLIAARNNGGRLPPKKQESDEGETSGPAAQNRDASAGNQQADDKPPAEGATG